MGSSDSKIQQIQKINPNQWVTLESKQHYDIVQHRINKNLAERTNILLDPKRQDNDQLAIYSFRNTSKAPIVKVEGVQKLEPKGAGICGNQRNLNVYSERIDKRFSEFPQLTLPQSVYCLREALQGYRVLKNKAGVFEVSEEMMGINNGGQFKVWTNSNFGENHPNFQKPILETTQNESLRQVSVEKEMVQNVIEVIEEKSEEGKFPEDLKNRLMRSSASFQKCQNELDDYIHDKRLNIVKKIHPNLQYIIQKKRQSVPIEVPIYSNHPEIIPYSKMRNQEGVTVDQIISSNREQQVISSNREQVISSNRETGIFRNTERIETENNNIPQYTSQTYGSTHIQKSVYPVSNTVALNTNKYETKYETPKTQKFYNSFEVNPDVAVTESIYHKPQNSHLFDEAQVKNAVIVSTNNNISESNVAKVNPANFGPIQQNKTSYTTTFDPQTKTSNLYSQGPAKITFQYRESVPAEQNSQPYMPLNITNDAQENVRKETVAAEK